MTENITTYGTTTFHTYVSESKWFDEILKKMCIPTIQKLSLVGVEANTGIDVS